MAVQTGTVAIKFSGLNASIKDLSKLQTVFHIKLAPKINYAVARRVKMYVGRSIDKLERNHPDSPGHNTQTPLKQFLRMEKQGGQDYEVRMDSGDGLDPAWVERGHVLKGHAPEYRVLGVVKPTWFFQKGVDEFKNKGEFRKIIRDKYIEAFGKGSELKNIRAVSGSEGTVFNVTRNVKMNDVG